MISFGALRRAGVLGMNRRNALYTLGHNSRKLYPLVDNKLLTKEALEKNQLPAPKLYFKISRNFEIARLKELVHLKDFVVKPARGAEGRGIIVFIDRNERGEWVKSSGQTMRLEDIEYHVSNILAGLFSIGGTDDQAFVEYCVTCHPELAKLAYRGVPDIRVILYRGVPVLSMLRLPTKESDGKANLHQGAVGVGIQMLEGHTIGGVHSNKLIDRHPDLDVPIAGVRLPFWEDMLRIAAKTYDVFKLGYMGVDFVVDKFLGPQILELNARPGLNIQLANREGLKPRLDAVDSFGRDVEKMSAEERIEISGKVSARIYRGGVAQ